MRRGMLFLFFVCVTLITTKVSAFEKTARQDRGKVIWDVLCEKGAIPGALITQRGYDVITRDMQSFEAVVYQYDVRVNHQSYGFHGGKLYGPNCGDGSGYGYTTLDGAIRYQCGECPSK